MIVTVRFKNPNGNFSYKEYSYNTDRNISLNKGWLYKIIANNIKSYDNPVYVTSIKNGHDKSLSTITYAEVIWAPPIKYYHKKIFVNVEKETVIVKWKDGTITKMKAQEGDTFDVEKGVALCFMKKLHQNRGAYYNVFEDIEYFEREE